MIAAAEEPSDDIWRTRSRIQRVGKLLLGAPEWIGTESGSSDSARGVWTARYFRSLVLSRFASADARSIAIFTPCDTVTDEASPPVLLRDFSWHREQDKARIRQGIPWPVTGIRFLVLRDAERIARVTRKVVRQLFKALPEWNMDPWAPDLDDAQHPNWLTLGFHLFTGRTEINGEWTAARPEHLPLVNAFEHARTALVGGSEPLGPDGRIEIYDRGPDGERDADGNWSWDLSDPGQDA